MMIIVGADIMKIVKLAVNAKMMMMIITMMMVMMTIVMTALTCVCVYISL